MHCSSQVLAHICTLNTAQDINMLHPLVIVLMDTALQQLYSWLLQSALMCV